MATFVLGLLLGQFLRSYFREKGKNLATKEDVATITREIEAVKAEYSHQLELMRSSLQARGRLSEIRYQREFEILQGLTERIVDLRDAAISLRPVIDYTVPGETEGERRQRRLTAYRDAGRELYRFGETRRPFFPESIFASSRALLDTAHREAGQYARGDPRGQEFEKYWDEAQANSGELKSLADKLLAEIRERAQSWELDTVE